ncbi:MAG TPA: RT0821/Lpp0805 family surface protein [Usitatibacter sp.]|nr:RT0821/Lpp0805 family surface protein [Usitatibacter sp.]
MDTRTTRTGLAMAAMLATLAACETPPNKQQVGAVSGAVLGGVVGSTIGGGTGRTVAIVAGTVAGAVIGGKIGQKMDEADKLKAAQALESTPTGQNTTWTNPDTGAQYTMTPTKTYEASTGPCRDFTVDAKVDGKPEKVQGSACRQQDGTWKTKG